MSEEIKIKKRQLTCLSRVERLITKKVMAMAVSQVSESFAIHIFMLNGEIFSGGLPSRAKPWSKLPTGLEPATYSLQVSCSTN